MSEIIKDIAYFVSFCIEQYGNKSHMNKGDIALMFDQYGVSDYLSEFYDVLHTESAQWILEDIDEFISKRRKEA